MAGPVGEKNDGPDDDAVDVGDKDRRASHILGALGKGALGERNIIDGPLDR